MDYIISEFNSIKMFFEGFCSIFNIDYTPEETTINNSTFIKTSKWLAFKRSVLNPNNNDNKCFQYTMNNSGKFFVEFQRLNPLSTSLIGKILIFHHKNKIIKFLK